MTKMGQAKTRALLVLAVLAAGFLVTGAACTKAPSLPLEPRSLPGHITVEVPVQAGL